MFSSLGKLHNPARSLARLGREALEFLCSKSIAHVTTHAFLKDGLHRHRLVPAADMPDPTRVQRNQCATQVE